MKIFEGTQYYTSSETVQLVGKPIQTLTAWTKLSDKREAEGLSRLIPAPKLLGKGNYRYWSEEDIAVIKDFAENTKFKWGELKELDPEKTQSNKNKQKRKVS